MSEYKFGHEGYFHTPICFGFFKKDGGSFMIGAAIQLGLNLETEPEIYKFKV
jgi:hypothetical protein